MQKNENEKRRTQKKPNLKKFYAILTCMGLVALLWFVILYINLEKIVGKRPSFGNSIFFFKIVTPSMLEQPASAYYLLIPLILKTFNAKWTSLEACAVESAALHNPKCDVFVLYANHSGLIAKKDSMITEVLTYPNVHIRTISLQKVFKNSLFNELLYDGQDEFSLDERNLIELLRIFSLRHWGGTYLSFDTLVLRNLEDLESNYAVANEETDRVTTSILSFLPYEIGHFVTRKYLTQFLRFYDEQNQVPNYDEKILFHIMQQLFCGKNVTEMIKHRNYFDFRVYGNKYFSEAKRPLSTVSLHTSVINLLKNQTPQRYAIYNTNELWNQTGNASITKGPQSILAMKNCPKVFDKAMELGL